MSFLGNVVWFVFGGLWSFLGYAIGGLGLCLTIIGIPFGIQAWKLGVASLAPFGKHVVAREHADGVLPVLFNLLWILLFGWEIALAHLGLAAVLALTVIGFPFAMQHIKLIPLCLLPFGRDLQ